MINIKIDNELKEKSPNIKLGVIKYKAVVKKSSKELEDKLEDLVVRLQEKYSIEDILKIQSIKDIRDSYKILGKDPSRYRVSSEALLRRILQGKGIYKVNNIVDVNNLVSLTCLFPVGSYNIDNIDEFILFRVGKENEKYKGIGKGSVNLTNMPVFADKNGAFGSPTSDSEKTMITDEAENLLMIIISFSEQDLKADVEDAVHKLKKYVNAKDIEYTIV